MINKEKITEHFNRATEELDKKRELYDTIPKKMKS